jgi:two-component system sensor histidine kinase HydH
LRSRQPSAKLLLALLTLPATISIAIAVVGFLAALVAVAISSAPGCRELRWFAAAAATAGGYVLSNATVTLQVPFSWTVTGSRVSLFFAGLHGASWCIYASTGAGGKTRISSAYRVIATGGVVLACVSLVPGATYDASRPAVRLIGWLGLTLRDATPTVLGKFTFAYFCASLGVLLVDYVTRWVKREPAAGAHVVAIGALMMGAVHDSLVASGVLENMYLIEPALLVVVLAVGGVATSRFVATARALDASGRKLAQAHEELVRHERLAALGELAATVAHEVRNPLAIVFNAVAGLRRAKPDSPDHDALLGIVQEEAERLRDMVSDLLEFARPREPVLAPANLDVLVAGAVEAAVKASGAREEDVVVTIAGEVPPFVCDEQLVRQAIINLVSNALEAEQRRGPVRIGIADADATVAIRVSDDGRGVPKELVGRIFTPFFSTRPTGTGLGLAVVQRSAETHGGEVAVTTTPGGGATFELRLPRRAT